MSLGDENDGFGGGSGQTRTRLPEGGSGDVYEGARRPAARSSRSLITVVGVVVLLVAAIAFANRGGNEGADSPDTSTGKGPGSAAPTSATGVRPVTGKNGQIPAGFAHDQQGAQSAAANYSVALVSADILKPELRSQIVRQLFTQEKVSTLEASFDKAYNRDFLDKLGLDEHGSAAAGLTYVSRTAPVGTKLTQFSKTAATVEVWCTGVFGTAGVGSTNPVTNDWFTITLALRWADGDWKIEGFSQKEGPAPVNTDRTASDADAIAKAVEEYGGFTYAR
ncbi:hypothetical protein [Streptomyces sp. NPDC047434]|uniref:hypothetical protein n=1 Tax=Streptomyces sp. NPDC047434 TaxID=3155143 RepID=UPI0034109C3D